jgi:hypothetical protein
MQFFVRGTCTMIDAAVQRDVDGIVKWSHEVSVPPIKVRLVIPSKCGRRVAGGLAVIFQHVVPEK